MELPTIPYSPVDLVNRRAAATGSVAYAKAAHHGDYNGHFVRVYFNTFRKYWVCDYTWAGRNVLGRGSLRSVLSAAKREYDRGARGTRVHLKIDDKAPEPVEEQKAMAREFGFVESRPDDEKPDWWTDAHEVARDALHWEKHFPGIVGFALKYEGTFADWPKARDTWIEEKRPRRR